MILSLNNITLLSIQETKTLKYELRRSQTLAEEHIRRNAALKQEYDVLFERVNQVSVLSNPYSQPKGIPLESRTSRILSTFCLEFVSLFSFAFTYRSELSPIIHVDCLHVIRRDKEGKQQKEISRLTIIE